MTTLRAFRVDGPNAQDGQDEMNFYVKVDDEQKRLQGIFAMDGSGIYYYRPHSHIMTPEENKVTRDGFDGYLRFEVLKTVFESLMEVGYRPNKHDISAVKRGKTIVLEVVEESQ